MAANNSQQRLLRTMLTGIPGLLALKNRHLVYEVVNPAFCQFLGKAPDEIVGRKDADLFPADEAKACQQSENGLFKTGLPRKQEQTLTGVEGKRWLDVTRTPVLDDDGDPAGMLLFARDITEFKEREEALRVGLAKQQQLEEQARQAVQKAQQADEQLKAAQAAHLRALQAANQDTDGTKGQLQEKTKALAGAQTRLQEREAELAALLKQHQGMQGQTAQLQQQVQATQGVVVEREKQLAALKKDMDALQNQVKEHQQRLAQLQAALANAQGGRTEALALAQQLVEKLKASS